MGLGGTGPMGSIERLAFSGSLIMSSMGDQAAEAR